MASPLSYISKYVSPTVLKNSGLLILDKVVAAAISFLVYFVTANYLGPEKLGIYNYTLSTVSLVSTFGLLGLDSLVIKDLIDGRFAKNNVLGTLFSLRFLGSLLVVVLSFVITWLSRGSLYISIVTIVLSSLYLFRSFQVIDDWFLARKKVSFSVTARIVGVFLSALIKIAFILFKMDLVYFAIATTIEFVIVATITIIFYKKENSAGILNWSWDWIYGKDLLKRGWVLILGSFFISIVARFDQYWIGTLKSDYMVGIYSPAAKISEFWYYVPLAFLDSVYPVLLEAKKKGEEIFQLKLRRSVCVLTYISVGFCLLMTIFASLIIKIFLNSQFEGATEVLRIYVWGTLGTVLIALWGRWLIIEGKQNQLFIVQFVTFAINVALNLLLIPKFGIMGAAWANATCYNLGWILVVVFLNKGEFFRIFVNSLILPINIMKKINLK